MRELGEELGLNVSPEELEFVGSFKRSARPAPDFANNSFNDMYILRTEARLSDLELQKEEISALKYVPMAEFYEIAMNSRETREGRTLNINKGWPLSAGLVPHSQMYGKFLEVMGLAEHKK